MNYIIMPMDYLRCDFLRLKTEWEQNNKIMWQIPVTPVQRGGKWVVDPKSDLVKMLHYGDVIYFYVCKIPTGSGASLSRILLRGVVEDEPFVAKYSDVYGVEEKQEDRRVIAFSIGKLTTLTQAELNNNLFLCYDELSKKYGNSVVPRGVHWPSKGKNKLSDELIALLENSFKANLLKNDFTALIKHFNQRCYFCGKLGTANDHKTFKRRNGTDYFEIHHFIQQNKEKKLEQLKDIIDDPVNKICLCSNCHNKIHYGRVEDVNKMLDILCEDSEISGMLQKKGFSSIIGEDIDPLKWIKNVYKTNKKINENGCDSV